MRLEILTPETKVFDGEVSSVTFPGVDGLFQVLNGHAPLMSLLRGGTVEYRAGGALSQVKITGGVVEVLKNNVTLLADGIQR